MSGTNGLPDLPRGWAWAALGDIAFIKLGKMLSPKAFERDLQQLPYLRNENVRWFSIDTSDVKLMGFTPEEIEKFRLHVGDLLVCEGGEPGRCAIVTPATSHFMYQKALHRVRPIANTVDPRLLQYFFKRFIDSGSVIERRSETTIQHLPMEKMVRVPVPLPPRNEQARIVAKIEELFSDLDAGVAALHRVRANLKRYRAAVLKAAVEGRLTETWRQDHPSTEPASMLLERILIERRQKWEQDQPAKYAATGKSPPQNWREKYQEPAAPDIANLPELLAGWCWTTIQQLNVGDRPIAYGVLQPGRDVSAGVPLIRVCDVGEGRVDVDQIKRIAPEISAQFQRTVVEGGEVLLTIVGTIGRTAVVPDSLRGANTARAVAVIPITPLLDARYVEINLRESSMRARLTKAAHEVARKTLNLEDVRPACIPLAPVDEQGQMIAEAERRLSVADAVEAEIVNDSKRASRLRQSILKRAFDGKLVPQDPADEPASTLVDRIKTARSTSATKSTGQKEHRVRAGRYKEPANECLFSQEG